MMLRHLASGTRQFSGLRSGNRGNFRGGRKTRDAGNWEEGKSTEPSRAELGIVKRKVALVLSYIGSKYHGLQLASQPDIPTIESVLVKALVDIGAMRPSNSEDISKVAWSRSSRTDKGVHAARIILSMKVELPKAWVPEESSTDGKTASMGGPHKPAENIHFHKIVELLNEQLPADIRAISCVRVSNGFVARSACTWREYEYVLPTDILTRKVEFPAPDSAEAAFSPTPESIAERFSAFDCTQQTEEEAVSRLNAALGQFVGTKNFHNFHNLRAKDVAQASERCTFRRSRAGSKTAEAEAVEWADIQSSFNDAPGEGDAPASELNGDENEDPDAEEPAPEEEIVSALQSDKHGPVHDHWEPVDRPITQKLRRTMYQVQGQLRRLDDGRSLVAVTIRGDGFNLNQIRLMMGAAVMCARGMVPGNTIEAALGMPFRLRVPIMPAQGLYLQYAGLGYIGNKYFALSEKSATNITEDEVVLMDAAQFERSEAFNRECIQPRIMADWHAEDAFLMQDWLRFAERFRPSHQVAAAWQEVLEDEQYFGAQTDERIRTARNKRIGAMIDSIRNTTRGAHNNSNDRDRRGRDEPSFSNLRYSHILPERFATDLVIHFNAYPGLVVERALRAVASEILAEKLNHAATSTEIIAYMTRTAANRSGNAKVDVVRFWATKMRVNKIFASSG